MTPIHKRFQLGITCLAFLASQAALAQTTGTAVVDPACGTVFNADGTTVKGYGLDGNGEFAQTIAVNDQALPFTQAVHVVNTTARSTVYDANHFCNTIADIKKEDLLVATYWLRNANPDPAGAVLRIEPNMQNNTDFIPDFSTNAPVDVGAWKRFTVPFRALSDGAAGQKSFQLRFGIAAQSFDFGGISVVNYGQISNPLPAALTQQFAFYYPGRGNPNATWRTKALASIEAVRKATVAVTVIDANGKPVNGAKVELKQLKSSFNWATALSSSAILDMSNATTDTTPQDRQRYRKAVKAFFNSASLENALKWRDWESDSQTALNTLDWARANSLRTTRGHNLVWPNCASKDQLPDDLCTATATSGYIRARVFKHIDAELGRVNDQLKEWDVVNEPYGAYDFQGRLGVPSSDPQNPLVKQENGTLGNHAIVGWYKRAHKIDPSALLYINDYRIFDYVDTVQRLYDYTLAKYLKTNGAQLDGIGFESHFDMYVPVFSEMADTLKLFDPLVAHYSMTEFDFTGFDTSLQADMTGDIMTYIFGSPKFNTLQMWGFWDGNHFQNSAPLFTKDWTLKPSGKVWQTLTQKTWRTNVSGTTDGVGQYATRAFLGTYQITVKACGKTTVLTQDVNAATTLQVPTTCQ